MQAWLVVNDPAVVSETIDGEVVIMHLKNGHYHSAEKAGALIWGCIEKGCSADEIERAALARYDAPEDVVIAGVREFIANLRNQDLVRDAEPGLSSAPVTVLSPATREPFAAPVLLTYTDMRDLLLLDPIHDVDEVGWPKPKPE